MSKPKRASLSAFTTPKETPAAEVQAEITPSKTPKKDTRVAVTLRMSPEARKQLRFIAVEEDRLAHDLLIEAINDLFKKHGKPPIA